MACPTDKHPNIGAEDSFKGVQNEDKNKGVVRENCEGQGERDMAPPTGNSIHRSGSRPQLDLSKAEIQGNSEERPPTILLPNQSDDILHLALDIGGSYLPLLHVLSYTCCSKFQL